MLDNIAQMLGTSLNLYNIYRMKRRQAELKNLQEKWCSSRGKVVTLTKDLKLHKALNENFVGPVSQFFPRIFETGYCPMVLEVHWPTVLEEPHLEKPVVFVFWCSGEILQYTFTLDSYDGTLPFEVLSEPEIL